MTSLLPIFNDTMAPLPEIIELYCSYLERPERVLYRYEIVVHNYSDEGITTRVYRNLYPVIGETSASWVFDDYGRRRHVLKGDGKRFAHDTEEKAIFSLRKRTRWRQTHAHWALTQAHEAIDTFNRIFGEGNPYPLVKVGQL